VVKVATAQTLWVPAVNNQGGLGRWEFVEINDPWNVKSLIRAFLKGEKSPDLELFLRKDED
jgi:type III restriction enzyme